MSTSAGDIEAIQHLREAIAEGKHWYLALLEAVRLWSSPEEDHNGRHYRYLIDKEAFDWLVLAERLCEEVDGLIPENELINFLFFDHPPIELSKDEFKELIGKAKYQAYLNYLYGVLVEEILILAVVEEIREFTYWLFKQRLKGCEKARVASDTSKALAKLHAYIRVKGRHVSQPS